MLKFVLITYAATLVSGDRFRFQQYKNDELFKYSPSDKYTLSADIDADKPPVVFQGEVQKAKTEFLENLNNGKKFKLQLKTQNGIDIESVGKLRDNKTFVVSGAYSFTGADGKRYKTRYTADEFGYHPITELDIEIPEIIKPEPSAPSNPFKFLNQKLQTQDRFSQSSTSNHQLPNHQLGNNQFINRNSHFTTAHKSNRLNSASFGNQLGNIRPTSTSTNLFKKQNPNYGLSYDKPAIASPSSLILEPPTLPPFSNPHPLSNANHFDSYSSHLSLGSSQENKHDTSHYPYLDSQVPERHDIDGYSYPAPPSEYLPPSFFGRR